MSVPISSYECLAYFRWIKNTFSMMYFHLERFKGCLLSMSKLHDFHTSKSSLKFTKKFIFHGHNFFYLHYNRYWQCMPKSSTSKIISLSSCKKLWEISHKNSVMTLKYCPNFSHPNSKSSFDNRTFLMLKMTSSNYLLIVWSSWVIGISC